MKGFRMLWAVTMAAVLLSGCAAPASDVSSEGTKSASLPASSAQGSSSSAEEERASSSFAEVPADGTLRLSVLESYDHRAVAAASGVTVYKDLRYGDRDDRADEGAGYAKGGTCNRHRSGQYFDLYLPAGATADAPVLLYLHGGSWSQPNDKDADEYGSPILTLAQNGFVVLSMDYDLQADLTGNPAAKPYAGVTFGSMVKDIDAMVSHMATLLPSLGLKAKKFAIAGASAGAHLAALYAWDPAAPQVMGLSLKHAMSVGFLISVGGPLDLSSEQAVNWMVKFQAINPAAGRLFSALTGTSSSEKAITAIKSWSPLALINAKTVPSIICYSHLPADQDPYVRFGMKGDGIVEVSSYDNIVAALEKANVPHANTNIEGYHCTVDGNWLVAATKVYSKYL